MENRWKNPEGELIPQQNQVKAKQPNNEIARIMDMVVFDQLDTPQEDLNFKPIQLLNQLQRELSMRAFREKHDALLIEKLTAWKKSVQKVEMAYEIIAYPFLLNEHIATPSFQSHSRVQELRETITDAFVHPNIDIEVHPNRAPIELNEEEAKILHKLNQAMELPIDPDKRIYRYSDLASHRIISTIPAHLESASYMASVKKIEKAIRED
jgi:hypothetical protein